MCCAPFQVTLAEDMDTNATTNVHLTTIVSMPGDVATKKYAADHVSISL
jgi:hypothetical protein